LNAISMVFPHGNTEGSRVHAGFYTSYLEIHHRILSALLKAPSRLPILITGHSRGISCLVFKCEGGALGEVCTAVLSEDDRFKGIIDFISYGKPRVGNPIFVKR
jgi:hypothetical protein